MKITCKFPAIVIYTNKVSKGKGYVVRGKTIAFVIIIGNAYKNDKGLLIHELTHVNLYWKHGLLIHQLLYAFIPKYRLYSECKAYSEQWKEGPQTEEKKADFTTRIWLFYKLKYPREYIVSYFDSFFKKI